MRLQVFIHTLLSSLNSVTEKVLKSLKAYFEIFKKARPAIDSDILFRLTADLAP